MGRMPHDHRGRDWGGVCTGEGCLQPPQGRKRQERVPPLNLWKEQPLDFDLLASRTVEEPVLFRGPECVVYLPEQP